MGFFDLFKKKQHTAPTETGQQSTPTTAEQHPASATAKPETPTEAHRDLQTQPELVQSQHASMAHEQGLASHEQEQSEAQHPSAPASQPGQPVAPQSEHPLSQPQQPTISQPEQPNTQPQQPITSQTQEPITQPQASAQEVTREQQELNSGLEKTKTGLFAKLARAVAGRSTVDTTVLDELEEILISSDVGVETTVKIIERIEKRVAKDKYMNTSELHSILRDEIAKLMEESYGSTKNFGLDVKPGEPCVVMVVGVNGAGKTTTIGKLAAKLTGNGLKVWIGAADTFRAAAIDQLGVWADRAGATMIHQEMGSDPASVAFDTLTSAKVNGADVVLIDTAGRLHNKVNLMNELTKIRNVMAKVIPDAPHEVMLVLDGSTGQNAFEQARQFTQATQVTSLAITKLDGTAKGGVVIGISDQFHIPVRYIGIGERIDQLRIFDRHEFVKALFGDDSK